MKFSLVSISQDKRRKTAKQLTVKQKVYWLIEEEKSQKEKRRKQCQMVIW